jgi:hypothetical protein
MKIFFCFDKQLYFYGTNGSPCLPIFIQDSLVYALNRCLCEYFSFWCLVTKINYYLTIKFKNRRKNSNKWKNFRLKITHVKSKASELLFGQKKNYKFFTVFSHLNKHRHSVMHNTFLLLAYGEKWLSDWVNVYVQSVSKNVEYISKQWKIK